MLLVLLGGKGNEWAKGKDLLLLIPRSSVDRSSTKSGYANSPFPTGRTGSGVKSCRSC